MKFKVKGLVFVGFAAAILSANAMAADSTVTSKSYVDAKINETETLSSSSTTTAPNQKLVYDQLATKQNVSNISNDIATDAASTTKYPSVAAMKGYVDSASAVSNFVQDAIVDGVTDKAPSQNIVYDQLALKQNASTAVKYDGTNPVGGATQPVYVGADGTVTAGTQLDNAAYKDVTTDTTLADAAASTGEHSADYAKLPTAGAVKAYVDSKSAVTNFVQDAIVDGVTDKAPSQNIVYDQLATKQDASEKASAIDTTVGTGNNDNNHFPTNAAVVTYVGSAISGSNNGVVLPAIDSNTCNSTTPCALVLAGDQPTWQPIQQ